MPSRYLYCPALLLFLLFFAPIFAEQPSATESNAAPSLDYDIGTKTVVYFDKSRERPVITEFYYPAKQNLPPLTPTSNNFKLLHEQRDAPIPALNKKLPLILVSHAYQGNRHAYAWLQELLAANGYIVAAPDHYGCTSYIPRMEECVKSWDRPKDISFLIDTILNDEFFKQYVNPEKIGFIGYDLGGITGVWLAGGIATKYPSLTQEPELLKEITKDIPADILEKIDFSKGRKCYEDKRVKGILLINPIYSGVFTREGLTPIEIPTLIISSDGTTKDSQFFGNNIPGAKLVTLDSLQNHTKEKETQAEIVEADQEEIASLTLHFFNTLFK